MTPQQITQWIQVGSILISGGMSTVVQFQAVLALLHPGMPEPELNQILAAIRDDARRRKLIAQMDQAQAAADAEILG